MRAVFRLFLILAAVFPLLSVAGEAAASSKAAPASASSSASSSTPAGSPGKNWEERCAKPEQGPAVCEIFQRLTLKTTGQRLLELAVGKLDPATKMARGAMILPLGIKIAPGVKMQIDEEPSYKFSLNHCTDQGCFAFVDLNEKILTQFQKGKKAKIVLVTADNKNVEIEIQLAGFTKAYKDL